MIDGRCWVGILSNIPIRYRSCCFLSISRAQNEILYSVLPIEKQIEKAVTFWAVNSFIHGFLGVDTGWGCIHFWIGKGLLDPATGDNFFCLS